MRDQMTIHSSDINTIIDEYYNNITPLILTPLMKWTHFFKTNYQGSLKKKEIT